MKQAQFIQQNQALWEQFEQWLEYQQKRKHWWKKKSTTEPEVDFAQTYRQICHHLALAQTRMYSPMLIERLNQLVIAGHQQLYTSRVFFWQAVLNFILRDFPALVRAEWRLVMLSTCLFMGSLTTMIITTQFYPDLVFSVVDGSQVADIENMYDPKLKLRFGREREADSDIFMFGYYIRNNTSIGFQAFASGLLFGIGTIFILLYNGLFIGSIAGHLTYIGFIETFWGFVAGHSAFELTAIILSGAAGFKLATALIAPGRKPRLLALGDNANIAIRIMYGAALLFLMAAFVEAFWSSIATLPVSIKYTVGVLLWGLLIAYFVLVARGHRLKEA